MTRYLNPKDKTKEAWLTDNAIICDGTPDKHLDAVADMKFILVCWVNNGAFSAVALVESEEDLKIFSNPKDTRVKLWFWIPNEMSYTEQFK
jgi:hypothetical protein